MTQNVLVDRMGIGPITIGVQDQFASIGMTAHILVVHSGVGPEFPPWKGSELTTILMYHIRSAIRIWTGVLRVKFLCPNQTRR